MLRGNWVKTDLSVKQCSPIRWETIIIINEHIISEYYNYILNLFKNHKFGFPIKTTILTENLLYNIKEIDNDNEIDVTNITNHQNYFDTNSVKVKDIYKVI